MICFEAHLSLIFYVHYFQSNDVKSSCHMEKEGLIRGVQFLESHGLAIGELVTERHVQIVKHVREEMPETKHYFDVWHVAKGTWKLYKYAFNASFLSQSFFEFINLYKSVSTSENWFLSDFQDMKMCVCVCETLMLLEEAKLKIKFSEQMPLSRS